LIVTKFAIPAAALDTHIGILGRTGSGKTFTARGMVERLLDAQRQVVIVDPTGAWWGLRSAFAIPIFGGEHGDVEITDQSGEAVAETILAHHSSAIVDLSGLARQSGAGMRRFMAAFIARLKDRERGALWLVLDEADEFLPQVLQPDMTRLFGDLKWIVRRGRVAGWRVMMITQRPQDIAKSVLTQIGTLVAHRLTAPQDRKAVEEWVKGHADPEEAKAVLSSLAGLQRGEAWVWSPENELLERAIMPPIRSFDSGATPDADSGAIAQPELASINMAAIRATLEERGPKAKPLNELPATDISGETLKRDRRIAELEAAQDEWIVERGVGQQQLDELLVRCRNAESALAARQGAFKEFAATIAAIEVGAGGSEVEESPSPHSRSMGSLRPVNSKERRPATLQSDSIARPGPSRDAPPAPATGLSKSQQRIIDALAWWRAFGIGSPTNEQVGFIAGYSPGSGNFNNLKGQLRAAGLVEYPIGGCIALTGEGEGVARRPSIAVTRAAFHDAVRAKLSASQLRLFDPVLAFYPGSISAEDVAASAGYSAGSGNFNNLRGQLRAIGLIEYPTKGMVKASGWLFP
jgi:hypothetical protein